QVLADLMQRRWRRLALLVDEVVALALEPHLDPLVALEALAGAVVAHEAPALAERRRRTGRIEQRPLGGEAAGKRDRHGGNRKQSHKRSEDLARCVGSVRRAHRVLVVLNRAHQYFSASSAGRVPPKIASPSGERNALKSCQGTKATYSPSA